MLVLLALTSGENMEHRQPRTTLAFHLSRQMVGSSMIRAFLAAVLVMRRTHGQTPHLSRSQLLMGRQFR
jgi:hypothetical protein